MKKFFIIENNAAWYLLSGSSATFYLLNWKTSFSFGQNIYLTFTDKTLDKVGYDPDIWINSKDSFDTVYRLIKKIRTWGYQILT